MPEVWTRIESLINKYKQLFGPLDGSELASTNVQAEIRTSKEEPIYTKSYPYPVCMREEVERQIKELLSEGVITPSKRPYKTHMGRAKEAKYFTTIDLTSIRLSPNSHKTKSHEKKRRVNLNI